MVILDLPDIKNISRPLLPETSGDCWRQQVIVRKEFGLVLCRILTNIHLLLLPETSGDFWRQQVIVRTGFGLVFMPDIYKYLPPIIARDIW
jgi:hypothetical protein